MSDAVDKETITAIAIRVQLAAETQINAEVGGLKVITIVVAPDDTWRVMAQEGFKNSTFIGVLQRALWSEERALTEDARIEAKR